MVEGTEGKRKVFLGGGIKVFPVQIIKSLYCHATELKLRLLSFQCHWDCVFFFYLSWIISPSHHNIQQSWQSWPKKQDATLKKKTPKQHLTKKNNTASLSVISTSTLGARRGWWSDQLLRYRFVREEGLTELDKTDSSQNFWWADVWWVKQKKQTEKKHLVI